MSTYTGSGAMGLERLIGPKHYIVLKWENRYTFWLNDAKTTNYIQKLFKRKLFTIKYLTLIHFLLKNNPKY